MFSVLFQKWILMKALNQRLNLIVKIDYNVYKEIVSFL